MFHVRPAGQAGVHHGFLPGDVFVAYDGPAGDRQKLLYEQNRKIKNSTCSVFLLKYVLKHPEKSPDKKAV